MCVWVMTLQFLRYTRCLGGHNNIPAFRKGLSFARADGIIVQESGHAQRHVPVQLMHEERLRV